MNVEQLSYSRSLVITNGEAPKAIQLNEDITYHRPRSESPIPKDDGLASISPHSIAEPNSRSTGQQTTLIKDSATNASSSIDDTHTQAVHYGTIKYEPSTGDCFPEMMYGGDLSIFAIGLPNGKRVLNWDYAWYTRLRAAMDTRRQLFEPDTDWYFPPGAEYGHLSPSRVAELLTLRKRAHDLTLSIITGKKAMFPPLRLKEVLATQHNTSVPNESGHQGPNRISNRHNHYDRRSALRKILDFATKRRPTKPKMVNL